MRAVSLVLAAALLASGAVAQPGKGGDAQQPIGAAARAKHGPEKLAAPPADVGMAEDPADGNAAVPVAEASPAKATPAKATKPKR